MTGIYDSVSSIRALHVVSEIPQDWLENVPDGIQADQQVVAFLLELHSRMNFTSGVSQDNTRSFISALVRDPLVVAFCKAAAGLQQKERGEVQAETFNDYRTRSYVVKIGLFYTPQELHRMRSAAPVAPAPVAPPPQPASPATRRLSFRGLKSISTGVPGPNNRP